MMSYKIFVMGLIGGIMTGACQSSIEKKEGIPVFKIEDMDLSHQPGNNFYQYANGGWMKNNPLPDDKSRYGAFDKLAEENRLKVKQIIETASVDKGQVGSVNQQIGDFYASGMDSANIEAKGLVPIQPYLEMVNAMDSKEELIHVIAYFDRIQLFPMFYLFAQADMKNSQMMIANIYQNGLGMPDRDYYMDGSERFVQIRNAYVQYLTTVFKNLGDDEQTAGEKAQGVLTFETRMAKAHYTRMQNRDPQLVYNKFTYSELADIAPEIPWSSLFEKMKLMPPEFINVYQPSYLTEVSTMLKEESLQTWKNYLTAHFIRELAFCLPSRFEDPDFEFYGKTLSGQLVNEPRWKRVNSTTSDALGEAIGQLFVKQYFPPEAKERMLKLVENLRIAFGQRIDQLDWMSDSTKLAAKEKLAAITVKIGYPNKWRDYSKLIISRHSYLENVIRSREFEFEFDMNKIGKPVDKEEWHMTPQTVNAYYNPSANEIVFPAAILQPPFFYLNGDDAVNYGAIGVVIGHEMTHGFDDQGRQYDKDGNLNEWWKPQDVDKFKAKTQVLVDQYNRIIVQDTIHANGTLTLGENIADLGGLNISYQAYRNASAGQPEQAKLDGMNGDQRFFMAYARVWAQNIREEEKLRRVKTDPHSLGEHRVNGPLPNLEVFVQAFGITNNDSLYIEPHNRAAIW